MSDVIKLKKGLDIRLQGKAETVYAQIPLPELFAIKPSDFKGLTPKMEAKVGDKVQAGSVLFYDKQHPEVKFVSPVGGELVAVNRGERRVITEIVVKADSAAAPVDFGKAVQIQQDQRIDPSVFKALLDHLIDPFSCGDRMEQTR